MKTYFLDTSALVKRYHREVGTDVIDKILIKYGFDYALRTMDSLQLAAMKSTGKGKVD
jgi:predicted nucleic acid-binding protein